MGQFTIIKGGMTLVERIASCLREREGGGLEFAESPVPLLRRLLTLEPTERAAAVQTVAEFGLFLEKKRASPQAAALLLETLESLSQQVLEGSPR